MFISFIQIAIQEAQKAFQKNEVPIGAVIVKNNQVIAKAYNQVITKKDATAHAEILAIQKACKKLKTEKLIDCDIYVTLEPCSMCAAAISHAQIKRLYYGASNPKEGAIEHNSKLYQNKSCNYIPEVYSGFEEQKCSELLKDFFQSKR